LALLSIFLAASVSAGLKALSDEEDDRATNRRYPEEEHIHAKHKVCRAVLYAYLSVILTLRRGAAWN